MSFRARAFVFQTITLFGLAIVAEGSEPLFESKTSKACDQIFKNFSNREMISQFSNQIKTFSSYVGRPEYVGKSLPETLNRMGESLKANPQLLQDFHKDFQAMMKSFEEIKKLSFSEREAQLAFAVIVNQSLLSRSFVASYLVAQATEKFLNDRSVVMNQKYYSAEDADIVVYSALSASLGNLLREDDDWDSGKKNQKITTTDLAKKLIESLEENSMHPDSLLGGTQILRKLFSKDAAVRSEAEAELNKKAERASRLREVFLKKWLISEPQ